MNQTKQAIETRGKVLVTILLIIFGIGIIYPVLSMACSSLSSKKVIKTMPASLIPIEGKKVVINGQECDLFNIEIDGKEMQLAHTGKQDKQWVYVDPNNPSEKYLAAPATPDQFL